jgi:RNA polymerase sigma-70 factor (ECF subfamily)
MDEGRSMQNEQLKALWERYCCRLLAFIRGRIQDESDAEDILQEVFIRIHRSLCCQEWNKPEGWIYRITRNLIIDHYRSRRETVEVDETMPAREEHDWEDDPVTRLAFSLRETIETLPEPYRQALVLTEYEGLSQKELASREGISLSGAKSRMQRAREKLRDLLLTCCHFELDRRGKIIDYHARCCACGAAAHSHSE